jgi:hypothetical protein
MDTLAFIPEGIHSLLIITRISLIVKNKTIVCKFLRGGLTLKTKKAPLIGARTHILIHWVYKGEQVMRPFPSTAYACNAKEEPAPKENRWERQLLDNPSRYGFQRWKFTPQRDPLLL